MDGEQEWQRGGYCYNIVVLSELKKTVFILRALLWIPKSETLRKLGWVQKG